MRDAVLSAAGALLVALANEARAQLRARAAARDRAELLALAARHAAQVERDRADERVV